MNAKSATRLLVIGSSFLSMSCKNDEDKARDAMEAITPPLVRDQSPDLILDPDQGYRRSFQVVTRELDGVTGWFSRNGFSVKDAKGSTVYGFNGKGGRFRIEKDAKEPVLTIWYFYDS